MKTMKATINHHNETFTVDFSKPMDISIPLSDSPDNPIAWYVKKPKIKPVRTLYYTGKVSEGGSTNFNNIKFNPHGHGTHTECLGHITRDFYSINQSLDTFFFMAELVSVKPEERGEDQVITKAQLMEALSGKSCEAVVIRTLPNRTSKPSMNHCDTNWPYLLEETALFLREIGVKHLLIDLPSVDREYDQGRLLAHKAFWNVKDVNHLNRDARLDATITEMVYVRDAIKDGRYLLNLQIASFENDATPSKPVLYQLSTASKQPS
jgi:kynurenine formamidase